MGHACCSEFVYHHQFATWDQNHKQLKETTLSDKGTVVGTNKKWQQEEGLSHRFSEWLRHQSSETWYWGAGSMTSENIGCLGDYERPHQILLCRESLWWLCLYWIVQRRRTTSTVAYLGTGQGLRHKATAGAAPKDWPHKYPGSWMARGQRDPPYFLELMFSSFWGFSLVLLEYLL